MYHDPSYIAEAVAEIDVPLQADGEAGRENGDAVRQEKLSGCIVEGGPQGKMNGLYIP